MNERKKPESTQELPTASIEGFARFIMEDRGGQLTQGQLYMAFAMRQNKMIQEGKLPSRDSVSDQKVEFYQGKCQNAADAMYQMLGIDEMGGWAAEFSSQERAEEFIEEVSEQFEQILIGSLKEENHG